MQFHWEAAHLIEANVSGGPGARHLAVQWPRPAAALLQHLFAWVEILVQSQSLVSEQARYCTCLDSGRIRGLTSQGSGKDNKEIIPICASYAAIV